MKGVGKMFTAIANMFTAIAIFFEYTMSTIVDAISEVFTGVMTMVGTVAEAIVSEPLLLFFCILSLVGIGIGIFSRLKRA